jgi:hypothetical protein
MGMLARKQCYPHRAAYRVVYKILFKEYALLCQPVNVRGVDEFFVIRADRIRIMVIAHDENDVGLLALRKKGGGY